MPLKYSIVTTLIGITPFLIAPLSAQLHVVGWQTFENSSSGNNNSGIEDSTPDTNTTYDPTPTGSNSNSLYLTGAIGSAASYWGRTGYGQATNNRTGEWINKENSIPLRFLSF